LAVLVATVLYLLLRSRIGPIQAVPAPAVARCTGELREIPVLVALAPGDAAVWRVEPTVVSVRLTACADTLLALRPERVRAFVDARACDAAATNTPQPVFVYIPPEAAVTAAETVPRQVRLLRLDAR